MTIKDQFLKNLENQKSEKDLKKKEYAKSLGRKINAALLDPEFIDRATKALIEHGAIKLTDVGCLCQDRCCSDQKSFTNYVIGAINYWRKENIIIKFGIDSYLHVEDVPMENLIYPKKIKLYNKNL